jgi:hypothetical protein
MRTKLLGLSLAALLMTFIPLASFAKEDTDIGLTAVTGTLAAMSGVTSPATITLTAGATTYTVEVSANTKVVRRFNGTSDLGEFLIGDTLQVKGKLSDAAANIITATWIKDLSVQRAGGTFHGSIVSLDCANSKFTYLPDKRVEQTVNLSANTKFIRGGEKIVCGDLKNGERAIVIGLWREANKNIYADRVIIMMKTLSGTITKIETTNGGLPATLTVLLKKSETWTVNITSATKLYRRYMAVATIDEFAVGDTVEARGTKATGNVLNAKVVRDKSIVIKNRDFPGRIKSIDITARSFIMPIKLKDGVFDLTVTATDATKYFGEEHETITFSDLLVGNKVKVLGVYNSTNKTLAAQRIIVKE